MFQVVFILSWPWLNILTSKSTLNQPLTSTIPKVNLKAYRRKKKLSSWLHCQSLQAMLVPLMTDQLVPPVEPLLAIPITARMEAVERAHDGEVFFEMPREVGIAAESLVAWVIGANVMTSGASASKKKKELTGQWQACQTPRLQEPDHRARDYWLPGPAFRRLSGRKGAFAGEKGVCSTSA
jgi:hypothetical protein